MKYAEMVKALAKPGQDIVDTLTADKAHNLHMAVGVCGEAGELIDAVKKQVIYGKPLDLENVIEELGDLEFYIEGLRQGLGITREQTLNANMAKLGKRYGERYSDKAAQERADKQTLPLQSEGDHVQVSTKITAIELARGVKIDAVHSVNGAPHLHLSKVMDVEEQLFRKRLIELGWTPPLEGWEFTRTGKYSVSVKRPEGLKTNMGVFALPDAILKARGQ